MKIPGYMTAGDVVEEEDLLVEDDEQTVDPEIYEDDEDRGDD